MISLWLLIIGIVFGTISSVYAKSKNRHAENWFTLGLFFWFFALIALYYIPEKDVETDLEISHTGHNEIFSY